MLVLGAQFGFLSGGICRDALPRLDLQPEGFAVVGMAAFFTGVVQSPHSRHRARYRGMTGSVSMLLPSVRMRGGDAGADTDGRSAHLRVASKSRPCRLIGPLQPLDAIRGRCLQADLQLSNDSPELSPWRKEFRVGRSLIWWEVGNTNRIAQRPSCRAKTRLD